MGNLHSPVFYNAAFTVKNVYADLMPVRKSLPVSAGSSLCSAVQKNTSKACLACWLDCHIFSASRQTFSLGTYFYPQHCFRCYTERLLFNSFSVLALSQSLRYIGSPIALHYPYRSHRKKETVIEEKSLL